MSGCAKTRIQPLNVVDVKVSLVGDKWLDGKHDNAYAYLGFGRTVTGTRFPAAEVGQCRCRYGDPGCLAEQAALKCKAMFGSYNLFRQEAT